MNEQERLEGSNVEYIVNKNNTYKFIVYYRSLSDENSSELTQEFIDEVTELSQQEDKIQNITSLSVGDNFIFNESTQTITGYNSGVVGAKDVIIPNQISGADVLHIGLILLQVCNYKV